MFVHADTESRELKNSAPSNKTSRIRRLRRDELPVDTVELARFLIGKILVRDLPGRGRSSGRRLSGRIVETEAYPVGDAACHAFRGQTPRNRSLFLAHGYSYVYFAYGSCWMMNVSSEEEGTGAGVLIRTVEPLEGLARMERHRGISHPYDIARGPGRLASAFAIDKRLDGLDLCSRDSSIWLGVLRGPGDRDLPGEIGVSTRIGISKEAHRLLRFYERGSRFVSGSAALRK
jgi:DNA-3-methyladenine glycosylase